MYASGNIILTDDKYRILALLRIVSLEQADNDSATAAIQDPSSSSSTTTTRFAVGELYPMKLARQYEGMTREKLVAMLTSCLPKPVFNTNQDAAVVEEGTLEEGSAQQQQQPNNNAKKSSKTRKKLGGGGVAAASSSTNLKKLVRQLFGPEYGPSFCDHCLLKSGLSPSLKFPGEFDMDPVNSPHINSLLAALQEADVVILETMRTVSRGYIMSKTVNFTQAGAAAAAGSVTTDTSQQKQQQELAYVDFHPYLFTQFDPATHPDIHITTFDTFDAAVGKYSINYEYVSTHTFPHSLALSFSKYSFPRRILFQNRNTAARRKSTATRINCTKEDCIFTCRS